MSSASNQTRLPAPRAGALGSDDAGIPAPLAGLTLGDRYRLVQLLGKGGMGSVYLARHVLVGKPVAVKILDSSRVAEGHAYQRLFREAQAAAAIGHPAIIDVHDMGVTAHGDPYLVMEYLEGEDLASLMERHAPLSPAAAFGVIEPILSALGAAHDKGIVHRDLKPANIYLVQRKSAAPAVKLIDFGIAKYAGPTDLAKLTLPGTVMGTPAYMAPEQARGVREVDARTDIYAVGVVLYQILTNRLPFEGTSYNELMFKIVHDEPVLSRSVLEKLEPDVRAIVFRAMQKSPVDRFQSAGEMLEALATLEAWKERTDALTRLAAKVRVRAFGGGDLGGLPHRAEGSTFDVYELLRRDAAASQDASTLADGSGTPMAAAQKPASSGGDAPPTLASGPSAGLPTVSPVSVKTARIATSASASDPGPGQPQDQPLSSRPKPPTSIAFVAAGVVLLAMFGAATAWWHRSTAEPGAHAAAPSASVAPARSVLITLQRIPPDATIRFQGQVMQSNPFRVEASENASVVRVEAPGFDEFAATVVPSQDVTLTVALRPTTADAPVPSASTAANSGSSSPPRKRPPSISKGARGTYYTETFE